MSRIIGAPLKLKNELCRLLGGYEGQLGIRSKMRGDLHLRFLAVSRMEPR